jgi:hypothetical protein
VAAVAAHGDLCAACFGRAGRVDALFVRQCLAMTVEAAPEHMGHAAQPGLHLRPDHGERAIGAHRDLRIGIRADDRGVVDLDRRAVRQARGIVSLQAKMRACATLIEPHRDRTSLGIHRAHHLLLAGRARQGIDSVRIEHRSSGGVRRAGRTGQGRAQAGQQPERTQADESVQGHSRHGGREILKSLHVNLPVVGCHRATDGSPHQNRERTSNEQFRRCQART